MAWLLEEEKIKVKVPFHKLNAETTAPIWQCDVKDWCQVFFLHLGHCGSAEAFKTCEVQSLALLEYYAVHPYR